MGPIIAHLEFWELQDGAPTVRESAILSVNKWVEDGQLFLGINNAQNWTKAVGRLAKAIPDHRTAMSILVCAQVERFKAMESGRTLNADPGGTDLQMAIDLAKISPLPQPISEEELQTYGVKFNSQGLLLDPIESVEEARAITDGNPEDKGNFGNFGRQTDAAMPEVSKAIIEELSLTDEEDGAKEGITEQPATPGEIGTAAPIFKWFTQRLSLLLVLAQEEDDKYLLDDITSLHRAQYGII
ncbi:uncharacterized protein CDV56_107086 [Aspergillus thermomutatus]|uniref:Uncharacterized protein n=1 Tax=Aspergillus thermomutatus TaxID=41047 RepID=A0A397GRF9_ASPTH|nr:uncharacterized protein CDV56_107086 [Aspergillus thermomutatus]RHZ52046.1 hypothetical protein CDV56_107086 [Aspergillus thermomutatus]